SGTIRRAAPEGSRGRGIAGPRSGNPARREARERRIPRFGPDGGGRSASRRNLRFPDPGSSGGHPSPEGPSVSGIQPPSEPAQDPWEGPTSPGLSAFGVRPTRSRLGPERLQALGGHF